MLNLEGTIRIDRKTIESNNLCGKFEVSDLNRLGTWCLEGYESDKSSRFAWNKKMQKAMDLAMQITKEKTTPWPGAANVAFPLVTIAALQFHARAYPVLVNSQDLVKYKILGPDPQGQKKAHADRVAADMSYQLLEQDASWEEQHDRLILNIAIVGCAFKKSYFSPSLRHNVSEMVAAKDLVLNYYAKSVESCPRKTHVIPMQRNEIHEKILRGVYRDVREEGWYRTTPTPMEDEDRARRSEEHAPTADDMTPYMVCEMHVDADLDKDGYAEPYIITFEEQSGCVLRIVTRFDSEDDVERDRSGNIVFIRAREYFTKYGLIPAADGSIYDIGFGVLLGPLNDSVSSILNQLIDAGTMANAAGGFIGRAKLRSGTYTFQPMEWKRIDSSADDIRKNLFPLPVREPSNVLFQLLSLLIEYTQRVSGSTDILSGANPGQNTPAETSRNMTIQGMKIFSATYKRMWRSMKEEFRKLFILNALHAPITGLLANREDYKANAQLVVPAAPPYMLTEEEQLQQAMMLKQNAMTTPGYNRDLVERNLLKKMHVEEIDAFFPGEKVTGPLPNPKVQIEQLKMQAKAQELKLREQEFMLNLMEERRLNQAKIAELEARAIKEAAQAQGEQVGKQIAAFEAAIGALKAHDDALRGRIELMMKGMENDRQAAADAHQGGVPGVGQPPGNATGAQVPAGQNP